jgi:hypothetical protein
VVLRVSNEQVSSSVEHHPAGEVEASAGGRTSIAAGYLGTNARDSGDDTCRSVHTPNAIVEHIRDEQVTCTVQR